MSSGSMVTLIIALVFALLGTGIAAMLFIRSGRKTHFRGFMEKINAHVNFQHFHLATLLKVLYVFVTLYAIINGLILLLTGGGLMGLAWMLLAPIALRLVFEQAMLLLSIREEAVDTNELLRRMQGLPPKNQPQQPVAPPQPVQQVMQPQQPQRPARPESRYPQRPTGYSGQVNAYGGYPPAPPRAQAQTGEYGMTQRYAPVRPNGYSNGYEGAGYDAGGNAVRPTPADGTGRFPVVSLKDDKGK